jgi:hypothetical protein
MTAHSLTQKEWSRPPAHRRLRNGLLQLGWPQFWLLIGILSGMLGLVALMFVAYLKVAR